MLKTHLKLSLYLVKNFEIFIWSYALIVVCTPQGQYQNDLRGLVFDNQTPDLPKIPGEYILEKVFQIDVYRSKWWDLTVLFSMIIIYRILFFIMIKINEDVTPWIRGYIARRRLQQKKTVTSDCMPRSPSLKTYVAKSAAGPSRTWGSEVKLGSTKCLKECCLHELWS